ncbi:hypothetical protein LTR66_003222 [Elasticomyces elasticus]|nr:hypothetical protein LTR66_003222 [Elasticomyces elasticus]
MTAILASTRSSFFDTYKGFELNPQASLYTEFRRIARSRGWKQGAKNSKTFEEAWRRCFGPDIPVGQNIDLVSSSGPENGADDKEMSSLLSMLQSLDVGEKPRVKIYKRCVAGKFTSHYGVDASRLEKWQEICHDCGIPVVLTSIKQCKKALKGLSINIYHLLEAKRDGRIPHRFPSKSALVKYMEEHPDKKFPLHSAKANEFLRVLLVECW